MRALVMVIVLSHLTEIEQASTEQLYHVFEVTRLFHAQSSIIFIRLEDRDKLFL